MLILLEYPDKTQQALVSASSVQGGKRLVMAKTKDPAWQQSQARIPSEESRDTVLWVVHTDPPGEPVKHTTKSSRSKSKDSDVKEREDDDNVS